MPPLNHLYNTRFSKLMQFYILRTENVDFRHVLFYFIIFFTLVILICWYFYIFGCYQNTCVAENQITVNCQKKSANFIYRLVNEFKFKFMFVKQSFEVMSCHIVLDFDKRKELISLCLIAYEKFNIQKPLIKAHLFLWSFNVML